MAPTLQARQYNCNGYNSDYNYDCSYSAWGSYGRWILLGCVIVGAFLLFLVFSCITARRRRRAGLNPYRGTAWGAGGWGHGGWGGNNQQTYSRPAYGNNQYGSNTGAAAPPVYSPPKENTGYYENGNGAGANQGYFGGQQSGIELQQPSNSYQPERGNEPVYPAPAGPPPSKDGIIR